MCLSRSTEALHGHINVPFAYKELRLQVTFCPIIFMENIIFLFSVQNPGMLAFNFTAKKVSLACNSCAGWVGGARNLISVPAVNRPHTKYYG